MKHIHTSRILRLALLLNIFFVSSLAQAENPIVHAVLFYSPTCPHCHKVITEDLTPLIEKHQEQLFLIAIDTSNQQGGILYQSAITHYEIPENRRGVPTLIVGEQVLVGSVEIPSIFPGIVEKGLAAGGIAWPGFPGLRDILMAEGLLDQDQETSGEQTKETIPDNHTDKESAQANTETNESRNSALTQQPLQSNNPTNLTTSDESIDDPIANDSELGVTNDLEYAGSASKDQTPAQRFARDKTGNTISLMVLVGMVFSVIGVGATVFHSNIQPRKWPNWIVPVLIIIGTGVSIYMGYIELTNTEAVCGPVGDCNSVQQSSYALLFGVLPIGVLGILGYLTIGIFWLFAIIGPTKWRRNSTFGLLALTSFGTLFSIYLTFLEPFVIGATCAWCLTSAVVMTLLLWASIEPAVRVLRFTGNVRRST